MCSLLIKKQCWARRIPANNSRLCGLGCPGPQVNFSHQLSMPASHALPAQSFYNQQRNARHTTAVPASRTPGGDSSSTTSTTSTTTSSSSSSVWQSMLKNPPAWPPFLGTLALNGAVMGTLLDGIHSRVGLQVYDIAPVTLGPLHTSLLVPPLLGTFYVVLGLLTCITDNLSPGPATDAAQQRACQDIPKYLGPCTAVLAANLACSAALFNAHVEPSQVFVVLAVLAAMNWAVFDRTQQGLGLAVLCGLGAPASELVLMALTGCWHYSRPDVAGVFVSWVPLCYAFYVPAVSNLARYLWAYSRAT